jgi:hypothetical protein
MVSKSSLQEFFAHRTPSALTVLSQEKFIPVQKLPQTVVVPKKSFFAQKSFVAFASALALLFVFAFATPAGAWLRM